MQPSDEQEQPPSTGEQPTPPPADPSPPQPGQVPPGYPPSYGYPPQPAPGYAPPGYGMQPGFPPPGQQPPPGYGYPPPGYGYPPLGYGYPPPGYGYPPPVMAYVPPVQYHVPPTDGRPPEFVAPAEGTLFQAWRSLATRPSRQNYVAWAGAIKPGWVRASILTTFGLSAGYAAILITANLLGYSAQRFSSYTGTPSVTFNSNAFTGLTLGTYALNPFVLLATIFAVPFGQAIFMSSGLGTVGQRYQRALRPWALSLVPVHVVALILGLLSVGLSVLIQSLNLDVQSLATTSIVNGLGALLFSIPLIVYQAIQGLQAGSVGSGMIRWAIFGIYVLTNFAVGIALDIILVPIFLVVVLQSIRSFTTTPSGFLPFH